MSKVTHDSQSLFTGSSEGRRVECLGLTFPSEDARRTHFREKLRAKLKEPEFRKAEGFPVASDDDILNLSDPPYYTACPNPFLEEFVRYYGKPYDPAAPYGRKPFAVDVSEGKSDPIYTAHSYHTKVPYKAIMRAILHYSDPGDLVLDGFAGSGMAGVAAQFCGVPDSDFKKEIEEELRSEGDPLPSWGARRAILGDLSPAATFISANYNTQFDTAAFQSEAHRILSELKAELGWMYETNHAGGIHRGSINYTVWSEVFSCADCGGEVTFVEEALDPQTKRVKEQFPCPHCSAELTKDSLQRRMESLVDPATGGTWSRIRLVPVLINYSVGSKKFEKKPDKQDRACLAKIADLALPSTVPDAEFPIDQMYHGSRLAPKGFTRIHHLYLPRTLQVLGAYVKAVEGIADTRLRNAMLILATHQFPNASIMNRYRPASSFGNAPLGGVYYVSSMIAEANVFALIEGSIRRINRMVASGLGRATLPGSGVITTTSGAAHLPGLTDSSIDYIFTDPPFGENIYYADLNFLPESWLRVRTDSRPEAIVDRTKGKTLLDYGHLMTVCLKEYCRVLKPGRWMTMVFHNSSNAVWAAIQESLSQAGFVVADVRTLDKQQGSYRQLTSTAVKQDLVISAYKPNGGLERRFELEKGTEDGVWDFVRTHLRQLPAFVAKDGNVEVIAERQPYLLFDRMVAFHVQRSVTVPVSIGEFFAGLSQRFPERDGMYFLPEQIADYDQKRMKASEVRQLEIFVRNEKSAIQWLRQQLQDKPQTFQEIHPQFMREVAGWEKHERPIELRDLLEQNFLLYEGQGEVPSQIHRYLSTNFHDLRKLPKDAPALRAKAKDRYYVPDPAKEVDVQKSREKALLREFAEYRDLKQKKLKVFRLEAIRTGFRWAWQQNDYNAILDVAEKIPEDVLQEDAMLLMWYTNSLTRTGRQS